MRLLLAARPDKELQHEELMPSSAVFPLEKGTLRGISPLHVDPASDLISRKKEYRLRVRIACAFGHKGLAGRRTD